MNFERRISRAAAKLDPRTVSSADRIAEHTPDRTLDELVEIFEEFEQKTKPQSGYRGEGAKAGVVGRGQGAVVGISTARHYTGLAHRARQEVTSS